MSEGEIALGRDLFADEIAWAKVRVIQAPKLGFAAMVPLKHGIWFSHWRAPEDFAKASHHEQGWFIHELAHVWQAEHGIVLALAKLKALRGEDYRVRLKPGAPLAAYNIEAQAEIARFLFLARLDARVPFTRADLEAAWPARLRKL